MKRKYTLFGVDANTTVLLDKPFFDKFKKRAEIVVNPAINGHDAYQIVIEAKENIDEYFVEPCDLSNEKGDILEGLDFSSFGEYAGDWQKAQYIIWKNDDIKKR